MDKEIEQLEAIESRGFCWSIGFSRLARRECRIFPTSQDRKFRKPVIIASGNTYSKAIRRALERLGDQVPHE